MTNVVNIKTQAHKHYVRIEAEILPPGSATDLECRACHNTIPAGTALAAGTIETCADPGTERTMIWCMDCFKLLGRGGTK